MNWYFRALKQYANSYDRARRKEYFFYLIINKLVFTDFSKLGKYLQLDWFSFEIFDTLFRANYLGCICITAVLIPSVALGTYGIKDTKKPGMYSF